MPKVSGRAVPMNAALDILMRVASYSGKPDEINGYTEYYFDTERSVSYRSNWKLKTQAGALERQRRETIQYLTDLRNQIDEVLAKLESVQPDEHGTVHVWSSAYGESKGDSDGQS